MFDFHISESFNYHHFRIGKADLLKVEQNFHDGLADSVAVLSKATLNAAKQLGLNQAELGAVLGIDRTAVSRMKSKPNLDPDTKQGEIALHLIRLARALSALTGADEKWIQHFMHTPNKRTNGIPAEQIRTISGLMNFLRFVEAISAKIC